jgi:outer membrane lipoprotein-sorting protein
LSRAPGPVRRSRSGLGALLLPASILSLLLGGCHPRLPFDTPGGDPESRRAELERRWAGITSLRAEAGISLSAGGSFYSGSMAVVMKKPGSARTDFFDPFGGLRGLVIVNGDTLVKVLPPAGTAGETPETLLLDRIGLLRSGAPGEELAALLTGLPSPGMIGPVLRWAATEVPEVPGGSGVGIALFRGRPVLTTLALPDAHGGDPATVVWGDYALIGDVPLPRRVTASFPRRGWILEITIKSVEFNMDLADELFAVDHGE